MPDQPKSDQPDPRFEQVVKLTFTVPIARIGVDARVVFFHGGGGRARVAAVSVARSSLCQEGYLNASYRPPSRSLSRSVD